MHPSPAHLADMSTDDLNAYREELRNAVLDDATKDDHDHPYRVRIRLIDAVLDDRRAPAFEPDPIADKRFRITYVSNRQPRIVTGEHFDKSAAFHPVLKLEVGEAIEGRYYSAGYRRVERIADGTPVSY